MKITERIEKYIKDQRLDISGRHREVVYKKMYLSSLLRRNGYTLARIGKLFYKDHVTVLYWQRVNETFIQLKDKIYLELTQVERDLFEPNITEKRNLIEDILECNNTTQLKIIKNRIEKGEY